jgi:hypothetical protein
VLVGDGFVLLVWIVLWIYGFVDALFSDPARVRLMPKAVWVILILIFAGFAAIPWFIWGRPKSTPATRAGNGRGATWSRGQAGGSVGPAAGGWQLGGAPPGRRSGPIAPDDDPDFLRGLGRKRDEPGGDTDRPS